MYYPLSNLRKKYKFLNMNCGRNDCEFEKKKKKEIIDFRGMNSTWEQRSEESRKSHPP